MVKYALVAGTLGAFVSGALAQTTAAPWGQCGGTGWTGATACGTGWYCAAVSPPWYYQCLQGSASSAAVTSTSTSTSSRVTSSSSVRSSSSTKPTSSTSVKSSSSVKPSSSSTPPTSTSSSTVSTGTQCASNPSNTLISGNSFIRGVESPYTHHYLQSEVLNTASDAVLGSYTTAAQFQIVSGKLVQNPQCNPLYAVVAQMQTGDVKLKVTWSSNSADTFGTFAWSGDTLLWSDPSVARPQTNAWLICPDASGNEDVYINLGNYSYMTPAGCGDQTIHAYTGSTATS